MGLIGIIVLYNPQYNEIIENIHSILNSVDSLICIDNSTLINHHFINSLKQIEKIQYYPMGGNSGLANALIKGAEMCISQGAKFALLLDQDSIFEKKCISNLYDYIRKNQDSLVCPNIKYIYRKNGKRVITDNKVFDECGISNINWTITSGSIINLDDYQFVGGFDKNLFIGQIDQDYCCNLKYNGFLLKRLNDEYMYQEFGNITIKRILGKELHIANYNPVRYYYIFRNELYLRKKWRLNFKKFKTNLFKYVIMILFENQKVAKLKMIVKATFKRGKL